MAKEWARKLYNSKQWKNTREYVLKRDFYLCKHCGAPAEEVHHLKHLTPGNINDISVSLNPDNLISLCKDCHFKQHEQKRAEAVNEGYIFDNEGYLIKD